MLVKQSGAKASAPPSTWAPGPRRPQALEELPRIAQGRGGGNGGTIGKLEQTDDFDL